MLQRYAPALARVASSYERDRGHREELLQEIVLAVWRAWPSFRRECSERAFVFRIAHNRALSHAWKHSARREADLEDERLPSPDPPAEQVSIERERQARLHEAVRNLPLHHREVVSLMLEDLSHKEIAEVLGISENNVAVRLTRARAALREVLRDE